MRPIEWAACIALGLTGGLWNAAAKATDPLVVDWSILLGAVLVAITLVLITKTVLTYPRLAVHAAPDRRAPAATTAPTG